MVLACINNDLIINSLQTLNQTNFLDLSMVNVVLRMLQIY